MIDVVYRLGDHICESLEIIESHLEGREGVTSVFILVADRYIT
jgi:hypothetical protein